MNSDKPDNRRGGRKRKKDREQDILSAWKCGERTIYEVSEITGYPVKTVVKYIPLSANG